MAGSGRDMFRGAQRPVRRRHLVAAGAVVLLAAVVVAVVLLARSLLGQSQAEETAERFVTAWERGDHAAMHELLTPQSQAEIEPGAFTLAYEQTDTTATATGLEAGEPDEGDGQVAVPITVTTAIFGDVGGEIRLPASEGGVTWTPNLVFPGLSDGERLTRKTKAPPRAKILARGGRAIVEGPADSRSSPLGLDVASAAGTVGPSSTPEERERLYARGFPRDAPVGVTGLERVFEREVAGTPGGILRAGERELASTSPGRAQPVETTIDADLHKAAVTSLGDRAGGLALLDARTGEVRALAGLALAGPQPPGSTFKLVTTTAALEDGVVTPSKRFPVETAATIRGARIKNAGGESCGGTFANSFTHSCNSVFAPLGVDVGEERLVETSERFGLNRRPAITSAETSTIPQPGEISSDLELGATAIGQGKLLTTPLQLASITQAIAAGGEQLEPRLAANAPPPNPERVTSSKVAATIRKLMVGVVEFGTGKRAAIAGVDVAGKTGTAELGPGVKEHAWFTAFAPVKRPKLAIAVLIANAGFGGDVAAPVAKNVLEAGLR